MISDRIAERVLRYQRGRKFRSTGELAEVRLQPAFVAVLSENCPPSKCIKPCQLSTVLQIQSSLLSLFLFSWESSLLPCTANLSEL